MGRSARRVLTVAAAAAIVAATLGAVALPMFFGDTNADGALNAADAVGIVNVLDQPVPTGLAYILADADGDFAVEQADADYLVGVILGLNDPVPIIDLSVSTSLTFFRDLEPVADEDQVVSTPITLWRVMPLPPGDEHATQVGVPSVDRQ